jgi:hypothetical protein
MAGEAGVCFLTALARWQWCIVFHLVEDECTAVRLFGNSGMGAAVLTAYERRLR